jgi:hypothetical protein
MMIIYAPHTAAIFQVSDLNPFGIFKLIKTNANESSMVHDNTGHIAKMIYVIKSAQARVRSPPSGSNPYRGPE